MRQQSFFHFQTERHLIAPVTDYINFILEHGFEDQSPSFSIADIHNLFVYYDENGRRYNPEAMDIYLQQLMGELDKVYSRLEQRPEDDDLLYRAFCLEQEMVKQQSLAFDAREISEWWQVSPVFGKYLLLIKEPVLIDGNNYYWGLSIDGCFVS